MTKSERLMMAAWWWTFSVESYKCSDEDAGVVMDTMIACFQAAGSDLCRAFVHVR